jgi:hypothetical protein
MKETVSLRNRKDVCRHYIAKELLRELTVSVGDAGPNAEYADEPLIPNP